VLLSVWLLVGAAAVPTSAEESPPNLAGQLTNAQKKLESMETQIVSQGQRIDELRQKNTEGQLQPLRTASQIAIAAFAAAIAFIAYQLNKINAAKTHIHGLFRDYLKLRFDYHQKQLEKGKTAEASAVPLNTSGETLAEQLAGIELYVLEEIFLWLEESKNKWIQKLPLSLSPELDTEAWRATIASHIAQYPDEVAKSVRNFAECYSVEFLVCIASVLKMPDITEIVKKHVEAKRAGRPRQLGNAILSYVPPKPPFKKAVVGLGS